MFRFGFRLHFSVNQAAGSSDERCRLEIDLMREPVDRWNGVFHQSVATGDVFPPGGDVDPGYLVQGLMFHAVF